MTHDELLERISLAMPKDNSNVYIEDAVVALRAVVELHKPTVMTKNKEPICGCAFGAWTLYPCPTIQAIDKELK